jgi:hypothetical protein
MSLEDWERYPTNLPHLSDHEDLSVLSALIGKAAGGLFSAKFELRLETSTFNSAREDDAELRSDVVFHENSLESTLKVNKFVKPFFCNIHFRQEHAQSTGTHIV